MESRTIINLVDQEDRAMPIEIEDSSDEDVDEYSLKELHEVNDAVQEIYKLQLQLENSLPFWERIANILIYTNGGEKFSPGLRDEALFETMVWAIHAGIVTIPTMPYAGPTLSPEEWNIVRELYNIKYEPKEETIKTEKYEDLDYEGENKDPSNNVLKIIKTEPQEKSISNSLSQPAVAGYARNNAFALPASSPTREQAMPDITATNDISMENLLGTPSSDAYETFFKL